MSLAIKLKEFERRLRTSFGRDISTPMGRFLAHVNFQLFDHAFLRIFWTNFEKIAPGVFRSNQPSPGRLKVYRGRGIGTILSLRGVKRASNTVLEEDACAKLGLRFEMASLPARLPARREQLTSLLARMRELEKPFLMHCKSGADRAGFAAVLYLHIIEGVPLAEARKQLSFRFLHMSTTATGIIDHFFDVYEARLAEGPIALERWIEEEYDPNALWESWSTRKIRGARA